MLTTDDFLVNARAEALFASPVSATRTLDERQLDDVVRETVRHLGGIRECAAQVAYEFGEHPDTACARMRWARRTVCSVCR